MSLPNVVTYSLAAASATALVNAQGTTAAGVAFTQGTTVLAAQRRVLITATGDESGNTFTIRGLNGAGFAIVEAITGPNATTTNSNLDFKVVSSIVAGTATIGTTSFGTYGSGSSMWNIMNWHVAPTNIQIAGVTQQGAATWTVQYTYDDPNNLPNGVTYPQPFNHPTLASQTAALDGSINDPVTGVRLLITAGTGTVRMTIIQAGIGSP